jgi:hypothetical protein
MDALVESLKQDSASGLIHHRRHLHAGKLGNQVTSLRVMQKDWAFVVVLPSSSLRLERKHSR